MAKSTKVVPLGHFSRTIIFVAAGLINASCAVIHKTQLADIEGRGASQGKKISIKLDETTVSLAELGAISSAVGNMTKARGFKTFDDALSTYSALFQFGPRTGTPIFSDTLGSDVSERLREQCKSGYLTNIVSVREAKAYPVVKGEIVRIDAICIAEGRGRS